MAWYSSCALFAADPTAGLPEVSPDKDTFIEITKNGGTELSGDILVAAVLGEGAFTEDRIYVQLPKMQQPIVVHLRIRTGDGIYDGKAKYTVPIENSGSLVALKFRPVKKALATLPQGTVVGLAWFKETGAEVTTILPVKWSKDDAGSSISIYLNSSSAADGGSLSIRIRRPNASEPKPVKCSKLTDRFICDSVFKVNSLEGLPVTVKVDRKFEGQIRDSLQFKLQ